MATQLECSFYNQCGFAQWRSDVPAVQVKPLPPNGDCGIPADSCLRCNPDIPPTQLINVTLYGPKTDAEMRTGWISKKNLPTHLPRQASNTPTPISPDQL